VFYIKVCGAANNVDIFSAHLTGPSMKADMGDILSQEELFPSEMLSANVMNDL
jgi:hypothetical protein